MSGSGKLPSERMAARLEHIRWRRLPILEAARRGVPAYYHAFPMGGTRRREPQAACGFVGLPSGGGKREIGMGDACPECARIVAKLAGEREP